MLETVAWRRAVARFGFAYWILFCSSVLTQILDFGFLEKTVGRAWTEVGLFVGRILGVDSIATEVTGSGDRTIDWLVLVAVLGLAVMATGVWTGLDREGRHDARVRGFVRIMLRYSLAFLMMSYGLAKLDTAHSQFPPPQLGRLTQPFGNASPMGMLWTFMGSSQAYTKFAGIGECVGGALLLSRRTTLAGALVLVPVLTNVVALNFCYDVPVKINSSHYLAMAIVLVLPDVRRILDVVLLRRAVPAAEPLGVVRWWGRRAPAIAVKVLLLAAFFVPMALSFRSGGGDDHAMWFDGYWDVDSFSRNEVAVPPITTDSTRWKRMKFESQDGTGYMRWHLMDGSYSELYTVADGGDHFTFALADKPQAAMTFALTRTDADHITIAGMLGFDRLRVTLHRVRVEQMPLTTRGFHWISEVPYNR